MSRRVLPVAVATAALVLVPSSAWATPGHAPVQTMTGESYYAYTQVSLADGRRVSASLSEFRNGPGHPDWQAALAISVMPQSPCSPTSLCDAGTGYAFLPLKPEDVDFDRNLDTASVTDLTVVLQRSSMTPGGGFTQAEETVQVDLVFTGTGDVVHDTYHGEFCGDGSSRCHGTRVDASREALAELTIDEVSGSAAGQMSHGRYVDAAIRPSEEGMS